MPQTSLTELRAITRTAVRARAERYADPDLSAEVAAHVVWYILGLAERLGAPEMAAVAGEDDTVTDVLEHVLGDLEKETRPDDL